ncbi:MAG: single-stranded-DNA-specific exonuclease RecJ [Verrucomicrobia bacterium]|jgi:single-stranded-DNA-specific exonuclease|nr:single-stranded-DNA-specific exonuclease RecJ [Verrucomicrobiota bacterium]
MRWQFPSIDTARVQALAAANGISPELAALLCQRGFASPAEAAAFLDSSLRDLGDPLELTGMAAAVGRVREVVQRRGSVFIFGDYDVDGVTSTVLLTEFLQHFGLHPEHAIPNRLTEGYGLSVAALERALGDQKPDLFIAVDCGTSSAEEVAWLRERNIHVLVLDHHTSKEALPQDCVLVNPHVHDPAAAPFADLCTVGLVFKFCHAFLKIHRQENVPAAFDLDLRAFLDLVALGTVADLVPLHGENRLLVRAGLKRLRECRRPGLCALMEAADLNLGETLGTFDIGFRLGPRINASGRLEDARLPIQLLLGTEWAFCRKAARELDDMNRRRQAIERAIAETAESMVANDFAGDLGLVLYDGEWHAGVVGIVASRLARAFHRPAIVVGRDQEGSLKGSGRSIEGVNLVEILQSSGKSLQQWGGHPMAVGLSIEEEAIPAFRNDFNRALARHLVDGLPEKYIPIDLRLKPKALSLAFLEELGRMEPFGQANPEPVFAVETAGLTDLRPIGRKHLRFVLPDAGFPGLEGVAWNAAAHPPPKGTPLRLAVRLGWNSWRGQRTPRLTLLDWKQA